MMYIEATADMKATPVELSGSIINLVRYSVEVYRPLVLRTVESKERCGTMNKNHAEGQVLEIVLLIVCVSNTEKIILDKGSESVTVVIKCS